VSGSLSPIAIEIVRRIDALFEIERSINGKRADERLAVRQTLSRPLVNDLHVYLRAQTAVGDNPLKFCGCRMPNAEEPGAGVDDTSGRPVRNVA
jgi:hypothetical protein